MRAGVLTSIKTRRVRYQDYKNPACGLLSDCAYNISSIRYKASLVRALIDHEMALPAIKNNGKKVFLAGFSEGAQMVSTSLTRTHHRELWIAS